jgi:4-hydroxy-4-methyl-2-oxoglutarate aldolase
VNEETAAALVAFGVATLHEASGRRGLAAALRLLVGPPFAGRAVTVSIPAGDNLGIHLALEAADPGSVLCVASAGAGIYGVTGDLVQEAARARSLAALVIDDGVRDIELLSAPPSVVARGVRTHGTVKRRVVSIGAPVALGRVLVRPGDWVVGDHDGVFVVADTVVDDVLARAGERETKEARLRERLQAGASTVDELGLGSARGRFS